MKVEFGRMHWRCFPLQAAVLLLLALGGTGGATGAELKQATLKSFESYIRNNESQINQRFSRDNFLWSDDDPARMERLRRGEVIIEPSTREGLLDVPDGLIHDWIGSVFIKGAKLGDVLDSVQDYNNHKSNYGPEVIDSRLLAHNGDTYKVYLRLKKKKVITVVLNTEHEVRYFRISPTRVHSRSYSTKIAEVENPGERGEREKAAGEDHGFLWRLYSYWRFEEVAGGVVVECQAISLTRDVPTGIGWIASPIIRSLPRESLAATLGSTRRAVNGLQAAAATR